ncbi:MAG: CPBP family intramembrane metalloprotease [Hymenobacteraceae bacterium]|nr:CPBP family intramembrane metalloprotease [Hymenobacteraceae bacterium]
MKQVYLHDEQHKRSLMLKIEQPKGKLIKVFLLVLVVGFILFVLPVLFFQIGNQGGFRGVNLAIVGVVQFLLVVPLIYLAMKHLQTNLKSIGLTSAHWKFDALLGIGVALGWALVQFTWLIPVTGGAQRTDIAMMLSMFDGKIENVFWYLPLGIVGGGITEEIYNRGFIIVVLSNILNNTKAGVVIAGCFSVLFFAVGHIPTNAVEWLDIIVPSTAYVLLFIYTKRLTAPIIAHSLWNTLAAFLVYFLYA